jgi:sulfite exporter TauE/SafE
MIALTATILAASLLGSLHCAGMCGGFVCFVAGQNGRRWLPQCAYHLGRLAAYVAVGALAGAVGSGIDRMGAAAGVSRAAPVAAGLLLVGWGGVALAIALGARLPALHPLRARGFHVPIAAALRHIGTSAPGVRGLVLGILTALLPCGWLWAFAATAASTGSIAAGMLIMAAFWIGTLPALAAVGLIARGALSRLGRRLPVMTAILLLVIGLLTLAGKLHIGDPRPAIAGAAASRDCH